MAKLSVLGSLQIASPCHVSWEAMRGDDRTRFCGDCRQNVFNLSDLTRAEAEALVREREGQACVRYYQRVDGTVLTADCPVGVRLAHRALRGMARRSMIAAAAVAAMLGLAGAAAWATTHCPTHQVMGAPRPRSR